MENQDLQKRVKFLEGRLNEVKLQYVDEKMQREAIESMLAHTKHSEEVLRELLSEATEFEQMLFDHVASGVPIPAPTTTRARIIAALEEWRYRANKIIG